MPQETTRRDFLKRSAALGAGLAASSLLAQDAARPQATGANEKIVLGLLGSGGRGQGLMRHALSCQNTAVAAVCDVYQPRLNSAQQRAGEQAVAVEDYRRVLDRDDIDAVIIATPDHWHCKMFLDAVAAGKDIYCEKPMSKTIEQGQKMVAAAEEAETVVQVGTQRRAGKHYWQAKQLIDDGKLGEIHFVRAYDCRNYCQRDPFAPPGNLDMDAFRQQLDWPRFQGPAPRKRLDPHRYFAWRWFWEYAGGLVTDVGVHVMDIVHLLTGAIHPKSVVCHGGVYALGYWQTPDVVSAVFDYGTHSVELHFNFTNQNQGNGIMLYGSDGTMEVRGSTVFVYPERGDRSKPEITIEPQGWVREHMQNFLDCVRSREQTEAPVQLGYSSLVPSHLANISYRRQKMIRWDADEQRIVGG